MKITAFPYIFSKNYHELSSFNGPWCVSEISFNVLHPMRAVIFRHLVADPWILLNELKRSMLQRPSGHTKGTF